MTEITPVPPEGTEPQPDTSVADGVNENRLQAAVEFTLNLLSDEELAAFQMGVTWGDGNMKQNCKGQPWFGRVAKLFTVAGPETDSDNLHPATVKAIGRAAARRLVK